ncbi:MAG: hypothetical protein ACE37F_37230 [Nannocystaceae bacterium]|nr:hypothetical protein [bacterium]
MSERPESGSWAGLAWVGVVAVASAVAAATVPSWLLGVAEKEGPVEAASAVVLLAAALGWGVVRTREGRGAAWVAAACAVVLAEELDWGAQLGLPWFAESFGVHNLHNGLGGASYLLFALPWVALFGAALWGRARPRWLPPRPDGYAFAAVAAVAAVSLALPTAWEQALDELSELLLYVLLAVGGLRRSRAEASGRLRA